MPSSRATRSSGSATRSSVEPSTNSPGVEDEGAVVADLDQLGEVLLVLLRVDEAGGVVAEDAEVAVERRSTDDGWMRASSSGSMMMRPAASASRIERSERITAGTLATARTRPARRPADPVC